MNNETQESGTQILRRIRSLWARATGSEERNSQICYFRQVFEEQEFTVDATDGVEGVIGSNVFGDRVNPNGLDLPVYGKPTGPTRVTIHKQIADGWSPDLFNSFGENHSRLKAQSQLLSVCRKYPHLIRGNGSGTLFEVGDLVAIVGLDECKQAHVKWDKLSRTSFANFIWTAAYNHFVVMPAE